MGKSSKISMVKGSFTHSKNERESECSVAFSIVKMGTDCIKAITL